jgi:hypothetical protein
MVFHWSCVLLLLSRIATRRIFIAIRLSSLNTAAHNRTHPIALSYSGDDLRFIGVRFLFSSIYIEQKRGYGWGRFYLLIALGWAFCATARKFAHVHGFRGVLLCRDGKAWNKILTYRWLAPRVRAPIGRMTYQLPWRYVATSFVSRSGSSQENKGSIRYNSITSNKDTNCNESPEGDREKPMATPPSLIAWP